MKRQLIGISLALATLISVAWWLQQIYAPPIESLPLTDDKPDYYAEQLKVQTFGPDGQLEQSLETPHMEQFESNATAHLENPVLWRYNPDSPPWRMQAEEAIAYRDEERVYMPGRVVIDRIGGGLPPYHIVTSDLTVETMDAITTTDAPVRIESGEQWIQGTGMVGKLKHPAKIRLLSQVRGHYVID